MKNNIFLNPIFILSISIYSLLILLIIALFFFKKPNYFSEFSEQIIETNQEIKKLNKKLKIINSNIEDNKKLLKKYKKNIFDINSLKLEIHRACVSANPINHKKCDTKIVQDEKYINVMKVAFIFLDNYENNSIIVASNMKIIFNVKDEIVYDKDNNKMTLNIYKKVK